MYLIIRTHKVEGFAFETTKCFDLVEEIMGDSKEASLRLESLQKAHPQCKYAIIQATRPNPSNDMDAIDARIKRMEDNMRERDNAKVQEGLTLQEKDYVVHSGLFETHDTEILNRIWHLMESGEVATYQNIKKCFHQLAKVEDNYNEH